MPKISVIVPVYKVEQYLCRCVDSILVQTFTDFELILVDDGSPDNCPAICDEYALKDSRIHVIHQENGGLSAARNAGIDWTFANSNSEWLSFIDSDDWVHSTYLEKLYKAVQETGLAVSICHYERTEGENPTIKEIELFNPIWDTEEFYCVHATTATIACGKLYKKECFQEIRYPVGKIHEDEFVTYRILFAYEKVVVIDQPLYAYYQNPNSIMNRQRRWYCPDAFEADKEQMCFYKKKGYRKAYEFREGIYYNRIEAAINELMENKEKLFLIRKLKLGLRIYRLKVIIRGIKNNQQFYGVFPVKLCKMIYYKKIIPRLELMYQKWTRK